MNSKGNIESWNSFIVTINQSTKRLAKLIDKVLDVTQLENELLILNKEVFDFENLVKEIVREYDNTIRLLNKDHLEIVLSIKNKLDGEPNGMNTRSKLVYADRVRIIQVIMNILENAVEFTKTGRILVDMITDDKSNEIYLSISDTGGGIDPKILPKLFTKFVSKSKKGTGLGLYICKKIIEAHNGKIWAENYYAYPSQQKVVGSKFTISLPYRDNPRYQYTP
jgi:signal transduction histidine kinase